jgi:phage baseplate assembly protein W
MSDIRINPLDLNPDVAVGILLPMQGSKGNFFNVSYFTIDQAKTNLRNLLFTNEGERLMQPLFGCNLRKIVFEPITDGLVEKLRKLIEEKVSFWLPYIEIALLDIEVDEDANSVFFNLNFNLDGNKYETASITFNIPLS